MYARRAAPRLGPHVEMTPCTLEARRPCKPRPPLALTPCRVLPATRLRATAGRGAHTRRDGARGAVRPVALSPVTAAMVHTHTSRAGRPYSARSFRWGRRPGGRGRGAEDARRRGASERRSERCVRCVISTPDMRYPYRIWPISGPLAVGVPGRYGYRCRDHRRDNRYRRATAPCRTAAERRPQRAGRATEGGARVKAVSGYIVNRPGPLSLTPPSTSHTDPLVCGLRPGRSIPRGPAALHPPLLFSEGRAPLEATGRRRRRRLRCLHGRRELLGGLAQNVLDRLLCRLDYCDARVRLEPIEDHLALERLLHARARLALLELLSTLQRLSL